MKLFFQRHLELFLAAAGLAVVALVILLVSPPDAARWKICAAGVATGATVNGILLAVMRQRQRRARRQAQEEMQHMLRDVVMTQLAIIRFSFELSCEQSQIAAPAVHRVQNAIDKISLALGDLSDESLRRWRTHYDLSVPGPAERPTEPPPAMAPSERKIERVGQLEHLL